MQNDTEIILNLNPDDIIIGLGVAERDLLATLIALFEDNKLSKRIIEKSISSFEKIRGGINNFSEKELIKDIEFIETVKKVESRKKYFLDTERYEVEQLRLILWIYIREAILLESALPFSKRRISQYATEITAALINLYTQSASIKKVKKLFGSDEHNEEPNPEILNDFAIPVIEELRNLAVESLDEMGKEQKEDFYESIRSDFRDLSKQEQSQLLDTINSEELNDAAIRKILITGGGLALVGQTVGIAGFSAYILAAQLSAFIPLVSGPALVSFVTVIANPFTAVVGTAAVALWAKNKANRSIQLAIAIRVISLLALIGYANRDRREDCFYQVLESFSSVKGLGVFGELDNTIISSYKRKWAMAGTKLKRPQKKLDTNVLKLFNKSVKDILSHYEKSMNYNEFKKTSWVAGLTVADFIYSLSMIDPSVIKAADFSRNAVIDDRYSFSVFANEFSGLQGESFIGGLSSLKGYVAEQIVATNYIEKGHIVEFPKSSNQEGWDLLIDGEKFQVKSLDSVSGIKEHFEVYDFPIIVNSELIDSIPPELSDKVYFVEGFSDSTVTEITEESISSGAEVFNPDIPFFAVCVSSAFAFRQYNEGILRSDQVVDRIFLEGSTRAGLASVGGLFGSGLGLLVYGPAGALIFGALTPILAQSQTSSISHQIEKKVRTRELTEWDKKLFLIIDELVKNFKKALVEKINSYRQRYRSSGEGILSDVIKERISDEGRYLHEIKLEIDETMNESRTSIEKKTVQLLRLIHRSTLHPIKFQNELRQIHKLLESKPSLTQSGMRFLREFKSRE